MYGRPAYCVLVRRMMNPRFPARPAIALSVTLGALALGACAAPIDAPSESVGSSSAALVAATGSTPTDQTLAQVPTPPAGDRPRIGGGGSLDSCDWTTTYPERVTLDRPRHFDDCRAVSMPGPIAAFFAQANAQAATIVADLNDCVARVKKVDACSDGWPKNTLICPLELHLSVDEPIEQAIPRNETCFEAELNAFGELRALERARSTCLALLTESQWRLRLGCLSDPASIDATADLFAASGARMSTGSNGPRRSRST